MKLKLFIISVGIILLTSCTKMDLNPLSEASSENWYSNSDQVEIALNDLYREYLWDLYVNFATDRWIDDYSQRTKVYEFAVGAITSEWSVSISVWNNTYKGISRVNRILENLPKLEGKISDVLLNEFRAEACFFRAVFYTRLITLYGDVPFFTQTMTIEEAFQMGRTKKETVLQQVYEDFDYAIEHLPLSNSGSGKEFRVNKGAALAMKARTALYMSDWQITVDAAQACIDLNKYSLYPDYGEYFRSKKIEDETIFAIPRSYELGYYYNSKGFSTRTSGSTADAQPSWDLLAAYLCTDGLPIDESPLFDPRKPFENRDPRCTATFVEHGTEHMGYIYQPHPDSLKVLNVETGQLVKNLDSKGNTPWAAFNCMMLKKYVTSSWKQIEGGYFDFPLIIMRYADLLLMYAEAKIELNEIDQSVLDAINKVRARAYKVDISATSEYPAVTTTNQAELRRILRLERRVELAWECNRFWDLHRWRFFEEAFKPYYGHHPLALLKEKITDPGLWFWPMTPEIDENGIADFGPMFEAGLISLYVDRHFEPKQYLWPIPNTEVLINDNIEQNPGY